MYTVQCTVYIVQQLYIIHSIMDRHTHNLIQLLRMKKGCVYDTCVDSSIETLIYNHYLNSSHSSHTDTHTHTQAICSNRSWTLEDPMYLQCTVHSVQCTYHSTDHCLLSLYIESSNLNRNFQTHTHTTVFVCNRISKNSSSRTRTAYYYYHWSLRTPTKTDRVSCTALVYIYGTIKAIAILICTHRKLVVFVHFSSDLNCLCVFSCFFGF